MFERLPESSASNFLSVLSRNSKRLTLNFKLNSSDNLIKNLILISGNIKNGYALEGVIDGYLEDIMGGESLYKTSMYNNDRSDLDILRSTEDGSIIFVELKIRDDHDRGKSENNLKDFINKLEKIRVEYPNRCIKAFMYFLDSSMKKHKRKYMDELSKITITKDIETHLVYGSELFKYFKNEHLYKELQNYYREFRKQYYNKYIVKSFNNDTESIQDRYSDITKIILNSDDEVFRSIQNYILDNKSLIKILFYLNSIKVKNKKIKNCIEAVQSKIN